MHISVHVIIRESCWNRLSCLLCAVECLFHGAVDLVTKACYAKQRCVIAVDDQNFRDPCFPGIRKYLTVLYACGKIFL